MVAGFGWLDVMPGGQCQPTYLVTVAEYCFILLPFISLECPSFNSIIAGAWRVTTKNKTKLLLSIAGETPNIWWQNKNGLDWRKQSGQALGYFSCLSRKMVSFRKGEKMVKKKY